MKRRVCFAALLFALNACSLHVHEAIQSPSISVSQFDPDYQNYCSQAEEGDSGGMVNILNRTGDFDGELAFTHEMNLFAIRSRQPSVFSKELLSLNSEKTEKVKQALQHSEKTLRLMAQAKQ